MQINIFNERLPCTTVLLESENLVNKAKVCVWPKFDCLQRDNIRGFILYDIFGKYKYAQEFPICRSHQCNVNSQTGENNFEIRGPAGKQVTSECYIHPCVNTILSH